MKIEELVHKRIRVLQSVSPAQFELMKTLADGISNAFINGNKILVFGNGGSAAESQHFTTELIGRFRQNRRSLPAISLNSDATALTAIANDFGYDYVFSRQVEGLAEKGDVVIGISTSGTSLSVINALDAGVNQGANCFLLTGNRENLELNSSVTRVGVGGSITALIQEMHLTLIHIVCELVEDKLGMTKSSDAELPSLILEKDIEIYDFSSFDNITWVNGCFDLIHEGHLKLLSTASKLSSHLVVGINSDESVRRIKGESRPLAEEESRAKALLLLGFVDTVVIFDSANPLEVLRTIRPKIVVKGEEYKDNDFPELDFLNEIGTEMIYVKNVDGVSTSMLIKKAQLD